MAIAVEARQVVKHYSGKTGAARRPSCRPSCAPRNLTSDPTLDDVFLDATGRTRARVAGDMQEVQA